MIYGLGRLTPAEAKPLFGAGWTPDPSVLTPSAAHGEADFLKMLIPANLIEALGRDYVPAVAVLSCRPT